MTSKRIIGYDAIKALAGFFIVLYHVQLIDYGFVEGVRYVPSTTNVIWSICSAGVPLFFMINGALTIKKYDGRQILKKVTRLLFVAIVWTIIFKIFLIDCLMTRKSNLSLLAFRDFYWFFYTLAILYFVDWLLMKLPVCFEKTLMTMIFIFPFLSNFFWDINVSHNNEINIPAWGHSGVFTLYSILYHRLGYHLKYTTFPKIMSIMLIVAGQCLIAFECYVMTNHNNELFDCINSAFPTIGALCITVGLFMLLKDANISNDKFKEYLLFLGTNALGVYIFHPPICKVIRMTFPHGLHPIYILIISFIVFNVSAIISAIIRKSRLKPLVKL